MANLLSLFDTVTKSKLTGVSITTFSITTFSIMTLSIIKNVTSSITTFNITTSVFDIVMLNIVIYITRYILYV